MAEAVARDPESVAKIEVYEPLEFVVFGDCLSIELENRRHPRVNSSVRIDLDSYETERLFRCLAERFGHLSRDLVKAG